MERNDYILSEVNTDRMEKALEIIAKFYGKETKGYQKIKGLIDDGYEVVGSDGYVEAIYNPTTEMIIEAKRLVSQFVLYDIFIVEKNVTRCVKTILRIYRLVPQFLVGLIYK